MLLLTRRIGERFMIGDNIEVVVLDVHASQIKLGIQAPKDVPVHREEVYRRIQLEKEGESFHK